MIRSCFCITVNFYKHHSAKADKKTKRKRNKRWLCVTGLCLCRSLFVFLVGIVSQPAVAILLIKIHSYAKAASYHQQSASYLSMPIQQFLIWACSSFAFLGFQQASRQASSLLSLSWHSGLCHRFHWLVRSLFSFRPSLALLIAFLAYSFQTIWNVVYSVNKGTGLLVV